MEEITKIRGEQIQDNTITTKNINYIDANKILVNNNSLEHYISRAICFTLYKDKWINNEYTLIDNNIFSYSNGILLDNSNEEQTKEFMKCEIMISNQTNGEIILKCKTQPTIDLFVVLILN